MLVAGYAASVRGARGVLLPIYLRLIPRDMLDLTNGGDGFNRETATLKLKNGSFVQFMTYEMEKKASRRQVNPENPIVQAYATMMKVAEGQLVLNESARQLNELLDEANTTLGQVLRVDQIQ